MFFIYRYYVQEGKVGGQTCINGVIRPIPTKCLAQLPLGSGKDRGPLALEGCPDDVADLDLSLGIDVLHLQSLQSPGTGAVEILRKVPSSSAEGGHYRKRKRFGVDDGIVDEILTLLNSIIVTPPLQIMNTVDWEDNVDLQNLPKNDKDVVLAFERWSRKLCGWKIADYVDFYNDNSKKYLFQDIHSTGSVYYSITESANHVFEFLCNSFGGETGADEFLSELVDILDRRRPKVNAMEIISPPSTGKTWFFDMICDFFINVGHLKNMNRYSQFPFQDCLNRRIILWNEPNCHPEFLDTIKTIYGGDRCGAAVKCKDDAVIYRTPLIVTTNNPMFPSNDALNHRRIIKTFQPWSKMKEVGEKKPHPLAFGVLLNMRQIQFRH